MKGGSSRGWWMTDDTCNVVVLRYRDGRTERCSLEQFSPRAASIDVTTCDGDVRKVPVDELKAVFFVKDPKRRNAEMELGVTSSDIPKGAMTRVEFFDGEIIRGWVQHYAMGNSGFFLYPTAVESNNERVFVVARALNTVDIEG